ncbi:MAG TPA: hypothetical protein VL485_27510 [Ktedonobacteraceae bacterium]|nr:hypothetical protein [Ktedonobacteraceae bacterium]
MSKTVFQEKRWLKNTVGPIIYKDLLPSLFEGLLSVPLPYLDRTYALWDHTMSDRVRVELTRTLSPQPCSATNPSLAARA